MITLIVLAIYILGVYVAYFQIQKWVTHEMSKAEEYQVGFVLSLLSWLVFPFYWIVWLVHKYKEE